MLEQEDILKFARAGAEARLRELDKEMAAIYAAFPELRTREAALDRPRRQLWNEDQRKAISERMRRYWAKRRAAEARAATPRRGARVGKNAHKAPAGQ